MMINSKKSKIATIIGSVLLIIMALFHGSGINYVNDLFQESNAEPFLKEIIPVLFAHPSIHLLGLAAIGLLTLNMSQEIRKILFAISSMIIIDSLAAFYLGAVIPGALLLISAFAFIIGGVQKNNKMRVANNV